MVYRATYYLLIILALAALTSATAGIIAACFGNIPFVIPFMQHYLSADHSISEKTIVLVNHFFIKQIPLSFCVFFGLLLLAESGRKAIKLPLLPLAHMPSPPRITAREIFFLSALFVTALYVRLSLLHRGYSYDELYIASNYLIKDSPFFIIKDFWPTNHIGYTWLAYLTSHGLHAQEWAMRLPALILGMSGLAALWFWTRRTFSVPTALLAVFMLSLSPAHILWSVTGRGYSGYILCAIMVIFLYCSLLRAPSTAKQTALIIFAILGITLHPYFIFFMLAIAINLILTSLRPLQLPRGFIPAWYSLVWATFLAGTLWLSISLRTMLDLSADPLTSFPVPSSPLRIIQQLLSLRPPFFTPFIFIVMIIGMWYGHRKMPRILSTILILSLLMLLVWLSRPAFFYARFWAGLLPFLFVFIAEGILRINRIKHGGRIAAILLTAGIILTPLAIWQTGRDIIVQENNFSFREAARDTIRNSQPTTAFCAFGSGKSLFQFYSDRPLRFLDSKEDLAAFRLNHPDFACFTIPRFSADPASEDHQMLSLLQAKTARFQFGDIAVYRSVAQ